MGRRGRAIVLDPRSDVRHIVKVLEEGDYIGEMALVYQMRRPAQVEAFTWTRIHTLTRAAYEEVREAYPEAAVIIEREIREYVKGVGRINLEQKQKSNVGDLDVEEDAHLRDSIGDFLFNREGIEEADCESPGPRRNDPQPKVQSRPPGVPMPAQREAADEKSSFNIDAVTQNKRSRPMRRSSIGGGRRGSVKVSEEDLRRMKAGEKGGNTTNVLEVRFACDSRQV